MIQVRAHMRGNVQVKSHGRRRGAGYQREAMLTQSMDAVLERVPAASGWHGGDPECDHGNWRPVFRLGMPETCENVLFAACECGATKLPK